MELTEMQESTAKERVYEIRTEGLVAPGDTAEIRVPVEKRCRTVSLEIDPEVSSLFFADEVRLGGRVLVKWQGDHLYLVAFCEHNVSTCTTQVEAGQEIYFRLRRLIDGRLAGQAAPFRARLRVVETEDVWSEDAWKVSNRIDRGKFSGFNYQYDFGPSDVVAPGKTVEMEGTIDLPFSPRTVYHTGVTDDPAGGHEDVPFEVTFSFRRYFAGERMVCFAKNLGERPAKVYVTVWGHADYSKAGKAG